MRLNDKKSLSIITLSSCHLKRRTKNNKKRWKFQLKGHSKPLFRQTHGVATQGPPIFTPLLRTKGDVQVHPLMRVHPFLQRIFWPNSRQGSSTWSDFPCFLHYLCRHLQIWTVGVYKFLRKWCVLFLAESQTFQLFSIIWIRWFKY
jgi:hypothetical protein